VSADTQAASLANPQDFNVYIENRMTTQEIATVRFTDAESGKEDLAIVRVTAQYIGLGLSREEDGDVEVFLSGETCRTLIAALQQALVVITKGNSYANT
jgi:hypothetical protein